MIDLLIMEEVIETSPSVVERDMSVVDDASKDVDAVVGSSSSIGSSFAGRFPFGISVTSVGTASLPLVSHDVQQCILY